MNGGYPGQGAGHGINYYGGRGPGMGGPGMGGHGPGGFGMGQHDRGHRPPPPPRRRGGCCLFPFMVGVGAIVALIALMVSLIF